MQNLNDREYDEKMVRVMAYLEAHLVPKLSGTSLQVCAKAILKTIERVEEEYWILRQEANEASHDEPRMPW